LSEFIFGRHTVLEALRAGTSIRKVLIASGTKPAPVIKEITDRASSKGIEVASAPRREIEAAAEGRGHQGVVAEVEPFSYAGRDELVRGPEPVRLLLIDGVTDPANLGSMLRSCEAFGFAGALLPRHRSATVTPAVRKVAAGAAERVKVAQVASPADAITWLQRQDFTVIGLDPQAPDRFDEITYDALRLCLVVGSEGPGLGRLVKTRCDRLIRIHMAGAQASINVSVAAAIAMAQISRLQS
jgi:23S rRNA (guanosine2251-2'-O)-methyltransferase